MSTPKEITQSYPFIIYKGCIYQYKGEVPEGATVLNAPNIDTAMGYVSEESVKEMLADKDKEIERLNNENQKLNKVELFRYEHGFEAYSIIYLINGGIHLYSIPMYGGEEKEEYIDFIDLEDLIEKIKKFT